MSTTIKLDSADRLALEYQLRRINENLEALVIAWQSNPRFVVIALPGGDMTHHEYMEFLGNLEDAFGGWEDDGKVSVDSPE